MHVKELGLQLISDVTTLAADETPFTDITSTSTNHATNPNTNGTGKADKHYMSQPLPIPWYTIPKKSIYYMHAS